MPQKYRLVYDNSSHTYIIPVGSEDKWDRWCLLDGDCEESWEAPTFAKLVNICKLTFENPTTG